MAVSSSGVPGYLGGVLHPADDSPAGTCFQLSPGVLATGCHVLADLGLAAPGARVRFAPLAGGPAATATVEQVDPAHDLAVLRTDSPLPASVTRAMPTETVEPGTDVVVDGFGQVPLYRAEHTFQHMRANGSWEHTTERNDGVRLGRLSTKDLLQGMSGAPVRRTSDDAVLGVVSGRYNSTNGWLRDSVWTARTEDLAQLAPRELSWFSPHLRTHEQVLRGLDRKEQYLTAQRLEFVSPDPGSASAPARLMGLLATQFQPGGYAEPQRGVLLTGVAGAGKTRTCFEVAALAQREPAWLVLHVESPVTAEELVQAAMEHARIADADRVLLVLDYLDSYTRLRLPDLGQELQTRDPEGRVACLASARPGALQKSARDAAERLFAQVRLEDGEEYRARVAAGIFRTVAPQARHLWDEDQLVTACSDRPVLALLIALALEKQAQAGQRAPDLSELRQDDLFAWLRRRLERDFGVPTDADREAGHSRPRVSLLASAVALLACPQDRSPAVESAVDRALEKRGDKDFGHYGRDVVARLRREGWLVGSGDRLELLHDIVADGLLDATLIPDGDTVQSRTAEELFDALLDDGPVFAQAVRHLSRWTTDQKEYRQSEIEAACTRWLGVRVHRIGELLAADALGETAFDLMARTPWQAGMLRLWDELVGPWLAQIEREQPDALPAVLAQAVDKVTGPLPQQLLAGAMACLEAMTGAQKTGVLLQALLHADGLGPDQLEDVTDRTLAWVGGYRGERRAVQLLGAALARADLPAVTSGRVVAAARDWLRRNPRHPAGTVLLVPLLEREDLGPQAKDVLDAALIWTVRNPGHPGITFVLGRALRRDDLGVHQGRAVGLALAWLRGHVTDAQATYVLRPLLRADLADAEADQAIAYARRWLARHDDAPHGFVLCALLQRDGSVVERALEMFGQHRVTEERQYLLRALLAREDLAKPHLRQTVKAALDWLRVPGYRPNASLLHLLLRRTGPGGTTWTEVSAAAVRWVERHATGADASLVLPDLLTAEPGRADTTRLALEWLAQPDADPYATYVLKPLLRHHDRLPQDAARQTVAHAVRWLESHADRPEARFVIAPLLALPSPGLDEAAAVLRAATTWLGDHAATRNADRVLSPLLVCAELPPGLRAEAEALAVAWLERHPEEESRIGLLLPMLAESGPGRAAGLLPHGLLRAVGSGSAVPVLLGLLDAVPSGTRQRAVLIDHTLDWLARRGTLGNGPDDLFPHLLAQPDLTGERLARAAELFLAWLEPRAARPTMGRPLAELLGHTAPAPWRAAAVTRALAWLSQNAAQPLAGQVLDVLLHDPDLPVGRRAEVEQWAKAWVEANDPGHGSRSGVTEALGGALPLEKEAGGGPPG
ncbi:serine protease [Streptomyces sp. NPDC005728]|uniref:serine protease n=1 Tax=Streptomyces sp. NPDC005728 TaxID=3157054 RepID=UPI0033EB1F40